MKKEKKTYHKRSTLKKRRHDLYATGKRSNGFMIKRSRCLRYIRKVCADTSPSFRAMVGGTGGDTPPAKVRIYKKAVESMVGGADAYMNLLMSTAYEIADPEGKRKNDVRLHPVHLEKAQKFIKKFTSK